MTRRRRPVFTPRAIEGLTELAALTIKHKGNRAAITAQLEADKEWARFCARHGLPRGTPRDHTPHDTRPPDAPAP